MLNAKKCSCLSTCTSNGGVETLLRWNRIKALKGTYYAKITFIRCLNTVVWWQCVKTTMPIMVKIHPLIFLYSKKIINSLSEWAVSDSPSVHVTEGKKSRPFVTLPYKHRHSPEWEAVVFLRHYWSLAVAAGDIQCQRQRSFSSVVFWDALTNIGVSIDSLHLSRWGHCG